MSDYKKTKKTQYADQIKTWKAKYGTVKAFFAGEGEQAKALFFRQPTREELSAAENLSLGASGQVDLYKKSDRHIIDCYLGGDMTVEQVMKDTSVYLPLAKFVLVNLIDEKKSSWEDC